jgi:hypothetical protein
LDENSSGGSSDSLGSNFSIDISQDPFASITGATPPEILRGGGEPTIGESDATSPTETAAPDPNSASSLAAPRNLELDAFVTASERQTAALGELTAAVTVGFESLAAALAQADAPAAPLPGPPPMTPAPPVIKCCGKCKSAAELEREASQVRAQNVHLESQLTAQTDESRRLANEVARLKAEKAEQADEVARLVRQQERGAAELSIKNVKINDLKSRCADDVATFRARLDAKTREVDHLQSQLDRVTAVQNNRVADLQTALDAQKREADHRQSQVKKATSVQDNRIVVLEGALRARARDADHLYAKHSEAIAKVEALRAELAEQRLRADEWEVRAKKLERCKKVMQVSDLHADAARLQAKIIRGADLVTLLLSPADDAVELFDKVEQELDRQGVERNARVRRSLACMRKEQRRCQALYIKLLSMLREDEVKDEAQR